MRTAEGLGVSEVIFSGYTPRYDDPQLLPHLRAKLNRQIEKSALGAEKLVPSGTVGNLAEWLEERQTRGEIVVGLENNLTGEEARRRIILGDAEAEIEYFSTRRSSNAILILGEEVAGIPPEIREKCDYFLEIPMRGRKESFNVSVAAGIAMWELMKRTV